MRKTIILIGILFVVLNEVAAQASFGNYNVNGTNIWTSNPVIENCGQFTNNSATLEFDLLSVPNPAHPSHRLEVTVTDINSSFTTSKVYCSGVFSCTNSADFSSSFTVSLEIPAVSSTYNVAIHYFRGSATIAFDQFVDDQDFDLTFNEITQTSVSGTLSYNECEGEALTMSASGNGNLTWTHIPLNGNPYVFAYGNSITIPSLSESHEGYMSISSDAVCESSWLSEIIVNPIPQIDFSTYNLSEICSSEVPYQIIPVITEDGQPSAGGTYHWSASSLSSYTASNPTWDPTSNQLLNTQGNKSIMLQYWTSNGCESIEYYDFFYNKMEVTLSATAYTCNGNNNPSATITANVTGGNPNYTYYWSSSINPTSVVGGSQITVDDQGTNTYYVSVFDDNFNCTAQAEITLPAPTPIAFDISNVTIPDAPCALPSITNNTNMIQFNSPTGGTAPYEHSRDGGNTWYNFAANQGFTSGSHTLMVRDQGGCITSENFTVGASTSLDYTVSTTDAYCEGELGSVNVTNISSNNSGNLNYILNTPYITGNSASPSFSIPYGSHTFQALTITSTNNSCAVKKTTDINGNPIHIGITNPNLFSVSLSSSDNSCPGVSNGTATANVTPSGPYTFNWSNGTTVNAPSTSSISGLLEGSAGVTVSGVFNGYTCTQSQSIAVNAAGNSDWWNHTQPGDGYTKIKSIVTDPQDNVYVAGAFVGSCMLGGHSFAAPQNYGEQQFFIAKFDHCGELVWVNYSDGFGYDCLNGDIQLAIEVGPSGDEINLHVALSLENTIPGANYELFNDQVLNNSNNTYNPILFESTLSDLLGLLKLRSSDGALLWDQTIANYSYTNTQLNDLAFANGALSIAGKINDQATVREIDLTSFSFNMPYTLVDNNTHNVISDIDFASNGDLFAIGQMTNTIDFGAGSMSPANTSDVFILKSNASGIVMNQLEVSEEANAVGIEVLANGRIAIAGNYRGDISSYIIPSYGSPSNMSGNTDAAFIADLDPNNLSINWLESSDHANTLPNTANNIESSVCAGISSNANSEVMVYGQFKGDNFWFTTGYQSSSMQLNAMGSQIPTSESIWTIKLSGFGSSNCNPHWANTLTEIEDLKTVAIAAGAQNHYIIGDFINNMNVAQWSFSSPNPASYVLRFGDVYDPNMGQFYKNENLEDELLEVNSLSIYPNPTHHELNIQWEQADELITIQIIDLTGRIVYSSENIDGKQALATISTENFDSGSYFVRLSSKEGIQEKPFIKL